MQLSIQRSTLNVETHRKITSESRRDPPLLKLGRVVVTRDGGQRKGTRGSEEVFPYFEQLGVVCETSGRPGFSKLSQNANPGFFEYKIRLAKIEDNCYRKRTAFET